jgi:hypothetical protein
LGQTNQLLTREVEKVVTRRYRLPQERLAELNDPDFLTFLASSLETFLASLHASGFDSGVVIHLPFTPSFVSLALQVSLSYHSELLESALKIGFAKDIGERLRLHILSVPQKVKPFVETRIQFGETLYEFRELDDMEVQVMAKGKVIGDFQQSEMVVIAGGVRKENVVQEADRELWAGE